MRAVKGMHISGFVGKFKTLRDWSHTGQEVPWKVGRCSHVNANDVTTPVHVFHGFTAEKACFWKSGFVELPLPGFSLSCDM